MNRADMILDNLISLFRSLLRNTVNINNKETFKHYRAVVAVVMSIIIAILLTPQITIKLPTYKAGTIAKKNILADHDFLVIDKDIHELKKLEAMADVHLIYDKNPDVAMLVKAHLNKTVPIFNRLNQQILSSPEPLSNTTLTLARQEIANALETSLNDEEFNTFCSYKFSPKILEMLKENLGRAYEGMPIGDVRPPDNEINKGIIVRDARTQTETLKKSWRNVRDIEEVRRSLMHNISVNLASENADVRKIVQTLSLKLLQPALVHNAVASEKSKQEVLSRVPPTYLTVLKNEMIIRKGERITEFALDKIEAMAKDYRKTFLAHATTFLGILAIVLLFSSVMYLVIREWLGKKEDGDRAVLFIAICLVLQVAITRFGIFIAASIDRAFILVSAEVFLFAIPFATSTLLVALMVNRNVAVCFAVVSSMLIALLFESKMIVASMSLFGGIIASYHIIQCPRRSAFFRSGFILGGINAIIIAAFAMAANELFSALALLRVLMGILGGFFASFLVAGLAPLFETSFGYITNIRLLELGNLNNEIFQRMIIEAPGTYHHSIVVASMVEAAAEATGANPLLAKTAAFYHDIGKVKKPYYFIENQRDGFNPHDKLNPKMSSSVIIAHAKDGCEIGEQIGLPRTIIDIIRQHHGTSLVSYFFNKAKNDIDESIRLLSEENFRYPGQKPQTKEAALVMLADVVEASTRTLNHPTPARIENLVRERITRVFVDGQLDECQLSMSDLYKIAGIFTRMITGIFHQRVDYPEDIPSNAAKKGKAKTGVDKIVLERKQ